MNWDIAVDDVFSFLPRDLQGVLDAAIFGEDLGLLDGDDLRDAQSGVQTYGKNCLVSGIAEDFEEISDLCLG